MAFDDPFNSNNVPTEDATPNNFYNFNDEDPAAEFLEREKRELAEITGDNDLNSFGDSFDAKPNHNDLITNGIDE